MAENDIIHDCERNKIWSRKQSFVSKGDPVYKGIIQPQSGKVRIIYEEDSCITVKRTQLSHGSLQ